MRLRLFILAGVLALISPGAARADVSPNALLERAMAAMGGRERLESIHTIDYVALGYRDMVEQSVRPTGPYFLDYQTIRVRRDYEADRTVIDETHAAYGGDKWWLQQAAPTTYHVLVNVDVSAISIDGGKLGYGGASYASSEEDRSNFAPERLLLRAASASDLRTLPDQTMNGSAAHVLGYSLGGTICRLYLSARTGLPIAVDYVRAYPYNTFLNPWGDVDTRITYEAWNLEPGGVVYPRQWMRTRVGLPDNVLSITQLHFNAPLPPQDAAIPQDIYDAHHGKAVAVDDIPLGSRGSGPPYELAPGVLQTPGGWNVEFVRQDDGIVVIEAPWSGRYTQSSFDAAVKRYGAPIKAVVTTSDSWPHIAGVRQAAADGIPIYALDLNEPILTRLLAAPHVLHPDDLARKPRAPQFHFVRTPVTIGSGANRIVVVPYRTATAERQMMVWFPQRRLLYTSDLFAPDGEGGWFTPEYLHEFLQAVARENLHPVTIFGMHYTATPFADVVTALDKYSKMPGVPARP